MPHSGGHCGGDVVVYRTDLRVKESVDERALSLFELADHNDIYVGLDESVMRRLEAPSEIGPSVGRRRTDAAGKRLSCCSGARVG